MGGTGTSSFEGIPFTNTGTVDVQTGTLSFSSPYNQSGGSTRVLAGTVLQFASGGALGGTFDVASDAVIDLYGGSFTLEPGLTFTGEGFYGVAVGGVTLQGSMATPNFQFTGGSISGDWALDGTMHWRGGHLAAQTVISSTGVLFIEGDEQKSLSGGSLTNAGTITWSGAGGLDVNNLSSRVSVDNLE